MNLNITGHHIVVTADVTGVRPGRRPTADQLVGRGLYRLRRDVDQVDVRPGVGEGARNRETDPAARAGDHRRLAVEPRHAERFLHLMTAYNARAQAVGSGFDMNPSPGNIKDGLITDAMKSAGAARKGGSSPVTDVLDYPEYATTPGLNLLCTPGNDVEATTALVAQALALVRAEHDSTIGQHGRMQGAANRHRRDGGHIAAIFIHDIELQGVKRQVFEVRHVMTFSQTMSSPHKYGSNRHSGGCWVIAVRT